MRFHNASIVRSHEVVYTISAIDGERYDSTAGGRWHETVSNYIAIVLKGGALVVGFLD